MYFLIQLQFVNYFCFLVIVANCYIKLNIVTNKYIFNYIRKFYVSGICKFELHIFFFRMILIQKAILVPLE